MTPLTPEQESEFTIFNCAVYDMHRKESRETESIPPCWLCMSDNAKQTAKEKFAAWFSGAVHAIVPMSVADVERRVQREFNSPVMLDSVAKWKAAELEYKRLREDENNPRAFFAA
jgi:hypothetical protein